MVPAICLALLGLAWLPADGELEVHTNKDRALQLIPKGTVCLFAAKKVERIQWLRKGRVKEKDREGGKRELQRGRIRDRESGICK